jgi:hypothetical protein
VFNWEHGTQAAAASTPTLTTSSHDSNINNIHTNISNGINTSYINSINIIITTASKSS